jgi:hydrogenase-4 component B
MEFQSAFRFCLPGAFIIFGSGMLYALLTGRKASNIVCSTIMFLGCAALILTAVSIWPLSFNSGVPVYLGGIVQLTQHLDPLSSFFLILLGSVGTAAAIFSPAYLKHFTRFHPGIYWFEVFAWLTAMGQVILADNAIVFLFFWEVMALSTAGLVITDAASHRARNAALVYLGATRMSTTLLFAGFIWLHALTNSWNFGDWNHVAPLVSSAPFLLIFLGLCIKAGCFPFHQWLPYAHPEAPAPVSALMSGVMVKVAIYAMLRLIGLSHGNFATIAYIAIFLGIISAFWGILYALLMRDLKQLLAYSTVENVGLIVLAFGVFLLSKKFGLTTVVPIALAACLLHCINHAFYKSLLFFGAGSVDAAAHTRDINLLGGLNKGMPFTSAMFLVGAMSICALPPLNGFASKWMIYQSIFHFALAGRIPYRAVSLVIVAGMAMVGALSVASFTKAFGLAFLGRAKTRQAEHAVELSSGTKVAQFLLAIPCVVIGFSVPYFLQKITPLCQMFFADYDASPLFTIPQPQLFMIMVAVVLVVYALALAPKTKKIHSFATWECGYGKLPTQAVISPDSYARSVADLFGPILQYRVTGIIGGTDRRHFPELIRVTSKSIPVLTYRIYRPIMAVMYRASKGLIRLQTASIHVHLFYVFATLLILILVGTQM